MPLGTLRNQARLLLLPFRPPSKLGAQITLSFLRPPDQILAVYVVNFSVNGIFQYDCLGYKIVDNWTMF